MLYEVKKTDVGMEIALQDEFSLKDTLFSGQTFRWREEKDAFYGIVGDKVCKISQNGNSIILHDASESDFYGFWCGYFGFDTDYAEIRCAISADENVKKALDYCSGIHIMNQPLWETVISFIISANNNIPRIMGIIDRLSRKFGKPIQSPYGEFYSFPTVQSLAEASVEDIHACGAGYRDVYIKKTAEMFFSGAFDEERLLSLPYKEAKKYIMTLPGVGPKVADCILLFAAGKEDAFPVDIWVRKVICNLYLGVEDARSVPVNKVEKFAEEHFPKYRGYAQQVLFHYMRQNQ